MKPEIEQLIIKWAEMQREADEIKEEILRKEEVLRDISTEEDRILGEMLKLCGYEFDTFGLKVDENTFVIVKYSDHYNNLELEIVNFENRGNDAST